MNRRGFLGGLAGILAAGVAPAAVGSSIIMPVRSIVRTPPMGIIGPWLQAEQAELMRIVMEMQRLMERECAVSQHLLAARDLSMTGTAIMARYNGRLTFQRIKPYSIYKPTDPG